MQQRQLSRIIVGLFFLSGLTGLIYQVLWTRMIVKIIGGAPFAVSIILTIFMGGLGLGSYLASRRIDRVAESGRLVKIYGYLEIAVGVYGLLLPLLLWLLQPVFSILYNGVFEQFMLYNILTFIGCAILLIIPVTCMGATLPVLSRFYVSKLGHLGTHTGRLYGLNTIGAGFGALLTGFVFLEFLGVWGSLAVAVVINLLIGLVSLVLAGQAPKTSRRTTAAEEPASEPDAPVYHKTIVVAAVALFGLSGFCSMAYEVIWTKLLGLIVGPTTYSFTVVLVTFIFGLALGAMIFGRLADRSNQPVRLLLITQVAAAAFALAISHLLGNSQLFFAKLIGTFQDSFTVLNFSKAAFLFAFMLPPTLCLGATFPLVGKIFTRSTARVGYSIGVVYAINTVGAVLGAFAAGFILVPWLGKAGGLSLVIALQLITAIAFGLIIVLRGNTGRIMTAGAGALALLVLALSFFYPNWDRNLLAVGKYQRFEVQGIRVGTIGWFESLFSGADLIPQRPGSEVVFYGDGIAGATSVIKSVDVLGNAEFSMTNSGKPDASTLTDMATQTLLAHFGMLFHPDPRSVMVLGLASGVTAGEVLNYPVERLDVLEISRVVADASRYFEPWNNNCLDDPRTELIIQDGRAHLGLSDRTYDVIISEPSNPWMAGLATLFTHDFFSYAHDHLADDGIFVQFIHTYQMDWETLALVGRTFADVFDNSLLVAVTPSANSHDLLLVGIKGDSGLNFDAAREAIDHLNKSRNISLDDPLLLMPLIRADNLAELFGDGPLNTDTRPRLEFAAPRLMFVNDPTVSRRINERGTVSRQIAQAKAIIASDPDLQLDFARFTYSVHMPFAGTVPSLVEYEQADSTQVATYRDMVHDYCSTVPPLLSVFDDDSARTYCRSGQIDGLLSVVRSGDANRQTFPYLVNLLKGSQRHDVLKEVYREWLDIEPRNVSALIGAAELLMAENDLARAMRLLLQARQAAPDNLAALQGLGMVYGRQGRHEIAEGYFREAVEANPAAATAWMGLGLSEAAQGKFSDAITHLQRAVDIDPSLIQAQEALERLRLNQNR